MNTTTYPPRDEADLFTLEDCEDGLNFLAYALRDHFEEGRTISWLELEETRAIATELLIYAANLLTHLCSPSAAPRGDAWQDPRLVRLHRAMHAALDPSTSERDLAEALQSAADLFRSVRLADRANAPPPSN